VADHDPAPPKSLGDTLVGPANRGLEPADLEGLSREELLERLCNDQVKRWHAGQRVPAEAYLALYPRLESDGEAAFELIYGEYLLREELGESPQADEFRWRFPRFAPRLERQLDLHIVLNLDEPSRETIVSSRSGSTAPPEVGIDPGLASIAPGYEILGELGRGGMGAVYKAWQVGLKRVVALKVIRADAYADSGAAARFHAEAEAVARFQHPNIVSVFEVGETDRIGYLVLEYAAGGGLDRRLAGALRDPHDSAKLLETLARAIHYAHQRGIVHRDLKPANVVLTEDGIPKITDFGLAKLLERDDGLTQVGDLLGTPSYMAPEQIRGLPLHITPATDVYALGAILYEMLTGRPPFKGTTPLSTLEQVSSQEPLWPSKLQRHTPRDVEIICLKCLEKEPRRRYASALALAEDLRRFQAGEPILARPTPAWERAWKWARRRPIAATAAASVVGSVLLLLGGALYYNAQLRRAVEQAKAAEQSADTSAQVARQERNIALKALKRIIYDVEEKLNQTPATRMLRQGLLNSAIADLEEIAQSTLGAPPDLSQADAHEKLGDIYRIIGGHADEARRHYERSRSLAEALLDTEPDGPQAAESLYRTLMGLGLLDISLEQHEEAQVEFRRAVEIAQELAALPGYQAGRPGLIEAYLQLGRAYSFAHQLPESEVCFRHMQDLAARWVALEPGNDQAKDFLSSSYRKLGDLKKFARDLPAAREDYLKAIKIDEELLVDRPDSFAYKTHLAIAIDDLAGVARDQGEIAEARQRFAEAERLFSDLVRSDPEHLESRMSLLHTELHMARLEEDQSQFAKAAELFRGILDQAEQLRTEGRLEGRHDPFVNRKSLATEVAVCEAAPRALEDWEFTRMQPAVVAGRLLRLRARRLGDAPKEARRLGEVAESLLNLNSQDPEDLHDLVRQLVAFIADLDAARWPALAQPERKSLCNRLADRAVALLVQAVERGSTDTLKTENPELEPLKHHAGYQALLARLKNSPGPQGERVKTSE
jgi:tetratricopeptide (TPR) repeat protein